MWNIRIFCGPSACLTPHAHTALNSIRAWRLQSSMHPNKPHKIFLIGNRDRSGIPGLQAQMYRRGRCPRSGYCSWIHFYTGKYIFTFELFNVAHYRKFLKSIEIRIVNLLFSFVSIFAFITLIYFPVVR